MEPFLDQFLRYEPGVSWQTALLCMLLSFVFCKLIAAVYVWTYRGLSYSRNFVHSLIFGGLVATLLMLAIGNNVARGLGLLGTLALIRFRATLKDTRDMVFVFSALAVGIAAGVQSFVVSIVGTLAFCLFAMYLGASAFGSRREFDGILRYQAPADGDTDDRCKRIMKSYCANFVLINLREVAQGRKMEHAYQVKLLDPSYDETLIRALRDVEEVGGVTIMMQDPAVEV